jgi:uncharacterized protein YqhQ
MLSKSKKFYYGGQAVIEGVMMRGRKSIAVAVRLPNGAISTHDEILGGWSTGRIRDIPMLRGIVALAETLVLGIRTLFYSASVALGDEVEVSPWLLWGSLALGFIMALALFIVLPLLATHFVDPYVSSTESNLIDGVIRLVIFIIYLWSISLIPDIRRVFAYHGAEHKTINAYEAGEPLEVEKVRKYSTAHSRCGTNFILIVMVIAIIAFVFLGRPPIWLRYVERILILPAIAAVSYEIIKFGAAHIENIMVRIALTPGLALQAMTTRQPDDRQIEVAISALKHVLAVDAGQPLKLAEEAGPVSGVTDGTGGVTQ